MAKINTSTIEGYENMTAEEKLAALESYEVDMTGYVKKDLLDKATSEAAGYKKQLRERMTEDEAAKQKAADDMAAIQAELETLRADKQIGEYTTQFVKLGYDAELAQATATAMQKGDMVTMFKNHAKFVAEHEKKLKKELLKDTPTPPAGDGNKGMTKEEFSKLDLVAKMKFAEENPDRYKEFYGGN